MREHGDNDIGQVDRITAFSRFFIEFRTWRHKSGDIGDGYPYNPTAFVVLILIGMRKDGVFEILGIDRVNCDERQVADVFACALDFGQGKGLGFLNDLFREGDADIIFVQAN